MVPESVTAFSAIYHVHNTPPPNGFNPIDMPLRHIFQIIFNNIPMITPLPRRQFRHMKIVYLFFCPFWGLLYLSCI